MTARQRLSPDVRRAQLEDAAVRVVAEVGFAAAGADTICAAAGVSKGLLWHYYDDVDSLLTASARRAFAELESAVAESVSDAGSVADLLRAAIRRAAQLPATHGPQLEAIRQIVVNLRRADGSQTLDEAEYAGLYSAQEALLRRGQDEGSIRSDLDPRLLAVTYQGTVDSMIDHLLRNPDVDAEALAELVGQVLLDGMATPT